MIFGNGFNAVYLEHASAELVSPQNNNIRLFFILKQHHSRVGV
jgi:hypothetical protein